MTALDERTVLLRTAGGGRLHIAPCPHIHGAEVIEATPADLDAVPICDWTRAELDGVGRTYHADLDDALRHYRAHPESWREIKRLLREVEHDAIWTPYSLSYIALGLGGRGVAWAGKTYVQYDDGTWVELDGYRAGGGGGHRAEERLGEVCNRCWETRALSGACGCV